MKRNDEINYWRDKSNRTLESAERDFEAGDLDLAVSGIFYALFYEVTALLLTKGLNFKTHSGVKSAFNKEFIKTGKLSKMMGDFFNDLLDDRFEADYRPFVEFKEEEVQEWIEQAEEFIEELERIIQEEM